MAPQDKAMLQLHDALNECFEQIRFARAAELARSGRYLEAEGLLSPNGRESSDPKELDLLARISAQQRQYGRARRLWETALQQSPGNTDYERAIECTKEAEHFQAMLRKGAMIALLVLAMAALVVAVWNFLPRHSSSQSKAVHPQVTQQQLLTPPQPAPTTPLPTPATPPPTPATPPPTLATPPPPASSDPQPAPPPTTPQPTSLQPAAPPVEPQSQ